MTYSQNNIQIGDPDTKTTYTTSTARAFVECKHKNGWYAHVKFWIFCKKVFVCSDCGEYLTGKKLKIFDGVLK